MGTESDLPLEGKLCEGEACDLLHPRASPRVSSELATADISCCTPRVGSALSAALGSLDLLCFLHFSRSALGDRGSTQAHQTFLFYGFRDEHTTQ